MKAKDALLEAARLVAERKASWGCEAIAIAYGKGDEWNWHKWPIPDAAWEPFALTARDADPDHMDPFFFEGREQRVLALCLAAAMTR